MIQDFKKLLRTEAATLKFGRDLARATFDPAHQDETAPASGVGVPHGGGIIHLHGDLGAGKTTLTRGILRGFGYEGAVKSPTYTLVEPYEFERCNIYHFDLYRLSDPEEVSYLGTEDYFSDRNLCIVEWAERGAGVLPAPDISLQLVGAGSGREVLWHTESKRGDEIAQRLWGKGRKL